MGDAELLAQRGDHRRLVRAFGAEAMIDGRGFDCAGPGRGGEQQQREAVGPARNGDADARARGHERVEVGGEARNGFGRRGHGAQLHFASALAPGSAALSGARSAGSNRRPQAPHRPCRPGPAGRASPATGRGRTGCPAPARPWDRGGNWRAAPRPRRAAGPCRAGRGRRGCRPSSPGGGRDISWPWPAAT